MQLSNIPGKLVLPFANAGGKSTIPVDSQIGITAGAASLTDGFPPLTRTPIAAGGVPPSGLDMNGILYEMSDPLRWNMAGGGYPYDPVFAADSNVGGYPKGSRVMRTDGQGYWLSTIDNNVTDPEATGSAANGWVPEFTAGVAAVTMTSANVTLTPVQYGKPVITITGTLTANLNLIFPEITYRWTVINNTSGDFTITAKTLSGVGPIIPQGFVGDLQGDAVNIYSRLADISASSGAALVGYQPAGTDAIPRTVQDKLREVASVFDFMTAAQIADVQANSAALDLSVPMAAALASGKPLRFFPGTYKYSTPLVISGSKKQIQCDDGCVFIYTGTVNALTITGNNHKLSFGEISAASATSTVKYYNLEYTVIDIQIAGGASNSIFFHDASLQTANAGNNVWSIVRLEAGGSLYGIRLDGGQTYTLEGESWNVKILYSAIIAGLQIGSSSANQKVRFNEYNIAPDAQNITPILVDVYNNNNYIYLRTWQQSVGQTGVRFNTNTAGNLLYAQPGVQQSLTVVDNGANYGNYPGIIGQTILSGITSGINNVATGTDIFSVENTSSANVTTKYVGVKFRGRDTINSGKDVGYLRALPLDANWTDSIISFYVRNADVTFAAFSANNKGDIYPDKASATTMTGGFFYIPAAAGAPTGVPSGVSGKVPMYYDLTNNQFYIYNAAWKKITLA